MDNKKKGVLIAVFLILLVILLFVFVFKKESYKVEFGGANVSALEVNKNGTVTKPVDPVRDGYKFIGWYTEDGKLYDFNTKVTKDLKLEAKWEKTQEVVQPTLGSIVTFKNEDGSILTTGQASSGGIVTKPVDPVKAGYEFIGWYNGDTLFDFSKPVTADMILTARFKKVEENKVTYTVTFDSNGGSKVNTQTIEENKTATKPKNPTRSGYVFVSWQLDGKDYNFGTIVTKNITLKATWKKAITYTVTFNSNGGSSVSSKTVTEGTKVTKPSNPTRSGYVFVSWQLNGSDYNFNNAVTKNITLTAKWRKLNTYIVTFNSNGGSSVSSKTVTEGTKVAKPTNPTRSGYTFNGWTLNGSNYNFNNTVTKNITLVANWKAKKYVIEATKVDTYSPTMKLTIKEDGSVITNAKVCSNGVALNGMTISATSLSKLNCVILSDGTQMPATVK